ncbi:MAG: LysR family transcriptional regulator [Gluconacetobacter diazotrophicus]|nr:LysR family transcriptional regulator [Gluconacetobacter diazotrophicus]
MIGECASRNPGTDHPVRAVDDRPDLPAIRAFVAIADAGSIAAGARAIGLTRSAAGKALVRLEDRLGTRLLHRTTRRLSLTTDGAAFHLRCTAILSELREAEAAVGRRRAEPRGTLRLSLPVTYGRLRVLPVLQEFLRTWPDVSAELGFTDRLADLVEEGQDLAIRIGGAAVPDADAELVSRVVDHVDTVICAAPGYLAAHTIPRTIAELRGHDRLAYGGRSGALSWIVRAPDGGDPVALGGPCRITSDSIEAIRDAAVAGAGIACLPGFVAAPALQAGILSALLPGHDTGSIPVHALYPTRRHLSARVRLFLDLLVRRLPAGPAGRDGCDRSG